MSQKISRFWSNVERRGSSGECWEWQRALTSYGYGITRPVAGARRMVLAHRVSWELVNGAIPDGMFVLHRCDNPPCCNPAHLFLGTPQDNVDDMMAKGRHRTNSPSGERCPRSKLTARKVAAIRALAGSGVPQSRIAEMFNTVQGNVSLIVNRKTWKSAP